MPIIAGAGLSIKLRRTDQVALAFFGDGAVEPSLKSFGGPYGAFLTHAKEYFTYTRKKDGRYIELRPHKYDELMNQPKPGEQLDAGDRWWEEEP